jgi:hypothetical protein
VMRRPSLLLSRALRHLAPAHPLIRIAFLELASPNTF